MNCQSFPELSFFSFFGIGVPEKEATAFTLRFLTCIKVTALIVSFPDQHISGENRDGGYEVAEGYLIVVFFADLEVDGGEAGSTIALPFP